MTVARKVVAGRTYMISRRCTQRQLLLRPEKLVEQIYLYCLGEAAQRYGITLHAFVAMSNHQHIIVRDNFPDFLAHFHKMVAKAMNALRGRWENFWATEQPNAVYLVEPADRFAKLVYVLANPVANHLVERVSDWPGASSLALHLSGRTKKVKRPRGFFRPDGNMPDEVTIRLERPDGFEALSDAEWSAKIDEAVRGEEARARDARTSSGRRVLGRKAVLRTAPHGLSPDRRAASQASTPSRAPRQDAASARARCPNEGGHSGDAAVSVPLAAARRRSPRGPASRGPRSKRLVPPSRRWWLRMRISRASTAC